MKLYKNIVLFLVSVITTAFSSTAVSMARYEAISLSKLRPDRFDDKKHALDFSYRIFTKADCKKYLGTKKIIARGYQPVQIQITNNSNQNVKFSLNNFGEFQCAPYEEVVEQLHFSPVKRGVCWMLGGFVLWPLFIVGIIDIIEAPKANDRISADFSRKSLTDQVIRPNVSINGLIFVPTEQFTPQFSFTVTNQSDEKIVLSTPRSIWDKDNCGATLAPLKEAQSKAA
jgi:hypothetical protein